jgi:hypothetical protein
MVFGTHIKGTIRDQSIKSCVLLFYEEVESFQMYGA